MENFNLCVCSIFCEFDEDNFVQFKGCKYYDMMFIIVKFDHYVRMFYDPGVFELCEPNKKSPQI